MTAFKAYDIRGVYGEDITEELAKKVGNAVAQYFQCKDIVVGIDMRDSSPKLYEALCEGITDAGANVHFLGMCTTPLVSYTVARKKFDCGIMISASHNPSKYNAFKLIKYPGYQVHADLGMKDIQDIVEKNEYAEHDGKGEIIEEKDAFESYITHVKEFAQSIRGKKIVVDYGNGVGALTAKPVLDSLDIEVIHMYAEPDGSFPNHEANPLEEKNLEDLKKKVLEEGADCGIAFDGDADRCIFVDEKGETVSADLAVALLVKEELKLHENKSVYFDLRFSKIVPEIVTKMGGTPVKMRVGNPFYKEALIDKGGALASELSGHMMFPENYCIDDGIFAAVKILNALILESKKMSDAISEFKVYFATEEINMKADPEKVFAKLKEEFSDGEFSDLDGITFEYKDWWFNLRKSNTEPLVRLRVEADTAQLRDEMKERIVGIIEVI
jgi:phosphomannomutase